VTRIELPSFWRGPQPVAVWSAVHAVSSHVE